MWIVGKSKEDSQGPGAWSFLGLYDTEEQAVRRCGNANHFVGPVSVNEDLPDEDEEWPGSYYPLAEAVA